MKKMKNHLYKQLISIAVVIVGIIFIALGILLPKTLLPVYEKTIYQFLAQPLVFIQKGMETTDFFKNVAYIFVSEDNIIASENFREVIDADVDTIIGKIDKNYGKFRYRGKVYYYYTSTEGSNIKISLTNDAMIMQIRQDILNTMLPILLATLLLISALLLWWSRRIVVKIEKLKEKVDNLDNENYIDSFKYEVDDELNALSEAIDNMKLTLKRQEDYKNQMYQNISHDFKTPLTVIKSYMEALDDNIGDPEESYQIIREQVNKLEIKVHSLLYLNKLNYIKDTNKMTKDQADVSVVIKDSVEKFKIQRADIDWKVIISDKNVIYRGTYDMWEAIIDNLLHNAIRYAKKQIKITMKNNRIIFYNDGPNIDPNILDDIFTPYKKGISGQFGYGLSIVKKTIAIVDYEISVTNEKNGVSFIIK